MRWNRLKIALVDDEQEYLDEMTRLCRDFEERCGCQIETVPLPLVRRFECFLSATEDFLLSLWIFTWKESMVSPLPSKCASRTTAVFLSFLTSSTEFMPDAFSCHAFEYITKPFSCSSKSRVSCRTSPESTSSSTKIHQGLQ